MIEFEIPGVPVGKQYRQGRNGMRKSDKTAAYASLVGTIAKIHRPPEPIKGAVEVTIIYYLEPPDHWSALKKSRALGNDFYCTRKPDVDNVSKTILDAMSRLIYVDDCQVVDDHILKFWGSPARTVVKVVTLEKIPTQPRLL